MNTGGKYSVRIYCGCAFVYKTTKRGLSEITENVFGYYQETR